jgi:hypothetical protein
MARIKGIVMENKNGQAVILTQQGEFRRITINKPIEVGEIYYGHSISPWKYALAAVVILALTMGTMDYFSVKAYAQVSDSLELGINRWNRVVTTRVLDDQGKVMQEQTNLTGKKIEAAVEEIADQALADGELAPEETWKQFPVQASDKGNKDQEFIERVEQNMNKGLQKAIDKRNSSANSDKAVKKDQEKDQGKDREKDQVKEQGKDQEKSENKNIKDN